MLRFNLISHINKSLLWTFFVSLFLFTNLYSQSVSRFRNVSTYERKEFQLSINELSKQRASAIINKIPGDSELLSKQSSEVYSLPFFDDFENGTGDWVCSGFFNQITDAEIIRVLSPDINPMLVTLPDAGYLPSAYSGVKMFWYGQASTGTFIGSNFKSISQTPKNGGKSTKPNTGSLISPSIDLSGVYTAQLNFKTWWEIEGVDVHAFDMMYVEISTDDGDSFTRIGNGNINPVNDVDGESWKSYSSGGLGKSGVWLNQLFDLTPYVGKVVKLRFRFNTRDQLYNGFRGWFIDNVAVTGAVLPPPDIIRIDPNVAYKGEIVSIIGENFVNGASVKLNDYQVSCSVVSSNQVQIITPNLIPGQYDVTLTNPDSQYDTLIKGLIITDMLPPTIISISPDSAEQGKSVFVTISGLNFQDSTEVVIGDEKISNIIVESSKKITGYSPDNLPVGNYNVKVINPDTQFDRLISAFRIYQGASSYLNVCKEDSLDEGEGVNPGNQIIYTICFDNTSNTFPAVNVTISDTLPCGVTFITASDGGSFDPINNVVTWNIGNVKAGALQKCVQLTLQVDDTVSIGRIIRNKCRIDSDNTQPSTYTEETEVVTAADFKLNVLPDTAFVEAGNKISFKVSMDTINDFSEWIKLSVSGLPAGTYHTFIPQDSIFISSTSMFQIQTSPATSAGTYNLIVYGSGNTLIHSDTVTLIINPYIPVYIYPKVDTFQIAGCEFWLDICVGDSMQPFYHLFEISFTLKFNNLWVDTISPFTESIFLGDFWGKLKNIQITYPPVITADTLSFKINRTELDSFIKGWGPVIRLKLKTRPDTPDTTICFTITSAKATDSAGNIKMLIPMDCCITVEAQTLVWPGDTNNDGIVNQADILPIGVFWNQTGYPRTGYKNRIVWEAQYCRPWFQDVRATYADANGDSIIDQNDVLVIGLNWHRRKDVLSKDFTNPFTITGTGGTIQTVILDSSPDGYFDVGLQVENVENILGIGIRIKYDKEIKIISVNKGKFCDNAPVFFYHDDVHKSVIGIAVSSTVQHSIISGSGCVAIIKIMGKKETIKNCLLIDRALGMDALGNLLNFEVIEMSIHNDHISEDFTLHQNYPNPFNSETTIKYELPKMSHIVINVYNLVGSEVVRLVDKMQEPGQYSLIWDGRNENGEFVSSGIYCFSIRAGDFKYIRKGLLLR